jgi:hypothetical protein
VPLELIRKLVRQLLVCLQTVNRHLDDNNTKLAILELKSAFKIMHKILTIEETIE